MAHEKHDMKETELENLTEDTKDKKNPSFTIQLLKFHDDLNDFLGE